MINNWEEDYKAFVEDIRSNYGEFHPSLAKYVSEFISNLLTKKDQEHKAELESIRGEVLDKDEFGRDFTVDDTLSIINSHINKLSTE